MDKNIKMIEPLALAYLNRENPKKPTPKFSDVAEARRYIKENGFVINWDTGVVKDKEGNKVYRIEKRYSKRKINLCYELLGVKVKPYEEKEN